MDVLTSLLPASPWADGATGHRRSPLQGTPQTRARERLDHLKALIRAATPTGSSGFTTVTVPVACGPHARHAEFRLPGSPELGNEAARASRRAAQGGENLSGVSLWRVPGLKADDAAVRSLFRDVLRVPAFVAAGIISCAAAVAERDEAERQLAVTLAEEAWLRAAGLLDTIESRERAHASVTTLLRRISPVRLGDQLCIRAGIDPSLALAAFDDATGLAAITDGWGAAAHPVTDGTSAEQDYMTPGTKGAVSAGAATTGLSMSTVSRSSRERPGSASGALSTLSTRDVDAATASRTLGGEGAGGAARAPAMQAETPELARTRESAAAWRSAVVPDNARSCVGTVTRVRSQLLEAGTSDEAAPEEPEVSSPYAFASLILPAAATTVRAVATSRYADVAGCDLARARAVVEGTPELGGRARVPSPTTPGFGAGAGARISVVSGSSPMAGGAAEVMGPRRPPSNRRSGLARLGASVVSSPSSVSSAEGLGMEVRLSSAAGGRSVSSMSSGQGSESGLGAPDGISPEAMATVAASARRSGEIILGMVGRAVSRWPFRRRVSILQLLRVVTPELCSAGKRRLPRAQCVHQALVDMGERSVEAGLPSVSAGLALEGYGLASAPACTLPFTPAALSTLCAAIRPGAHCHSEARRRVLEAALRDAAAVVAASPPRAVPGSTTPPASVSTILRRLTMASSGPGHRTRRVPLTGFCGIIDALAERHPDLAPIAGSASARRRYCDFVLAGVASALGGDHTRGLAIRELRASNLGVALQACATGHLQRVQPFALELFTPVEQRFLSASRLGVTSRRGGATPTPGARPSAISERFPPAVRRAAIACLLDTSSMPVRAADGRPLVDPALARILDEHAELLCLPAAPGLVSPWQLLCAIDAPVPRIVRMAVRALARRSWFRSCFPSVDLRSLAVGSPEDEITPRDDFGPMPGTSSPTASGGRDGRVSTPRSGAGSPSGGGGGFGFDADETEAQMSVTLAFRATTLLSLRLVGGSVRRLDSGEVGMLSFVDWVNLECANGYLGQLNMDWLWCAAIAGHAGPDVIPQASVRAAAEERVWDALRLQFPPEGPATVCGDETAKAAVEAAVKAAAMAARRASDLTTARTAATHASAASSAASSSLSMMEAPGGHFRRPVLTMRGVERSFASVPAQSVFMDGFVSPASRRQVGDAHASSRQMRRLVAQQLTTSTGRSERSRGPLLLSTERTPTSGRVADGSPMYGATPLTPAVRREWLRLHAAARQDVMRILISVGDLFRPASLVQAMAGDGAVDIRVQTARRSWPAGGILPLLVDRVLVSASAPSGDEE